MCEESKSDYVQWMMKKYSLFIKKHPFSALPDSTYTDKRGHSADGEGNEHKCKKGRRKSGSKKHRAGKNQKRKYKPYHKLTSAEQEKVDERISRRSSRQREYLHSCGVPLAPLNTTQFLVNDSIDANSLLKKFEDRDDSADAGSFLANDGMDKKWEDDSADGSSASEYESYAETDDLWSPDDFQEMWSRRFEHQSQADLAEWYYSLEEEVERVKEDLEIEQKIIVFEGEVRRYEWEVEALRRLNEKLIKMVKDLPCKDELAKILEEFPIYGEKHRDLEKDDSPCKDELPKIPKDLHLEEDNSPSKDELPKILEEFPVYDELAIDEKHQDPEEDNLSCLLDEFAKIPKDFPFEDEKVIDEKDRHLEEDMLSVAPLSNED